MAKLAVNDPNLIAGIVQSLGGTIVPHANLRFDLPLSEVKNVVPRLNELGVGCRKVSERVTENPTKLFSEITVATIECLKQPQRPKVDGLDIGKDRLLEGW